ncbi:MAG TPA: secondary thiamine-phosphate synthase enzyme [Candidatus Omnitrophica bacterium]|nr:MAG: secondary thiamine-phosphate synthase enzyme [Omnitrophica WOR_2 bacterium GWA2_63_20]OGX18736.1 MAG: secondary thiamine-phosphate synthase enzyme [Omnitrophica WOR_2 bacterium GWF2_63_9]OGX30880.1 MAG: secondary thiamine-phosphate synthase enzyme [Omnitrophica WOR_2 bacterium RIFCSPHIGHO2_12_FULL_64_13]OGX36510.1 MAG: secondary thiamine-phosphate synthase enzyme [Omnitrophica WOR_2 bacterium RIFCSPHIGHO2_02_FULL_63_39]OGX46276.1 MAG: secondary thiamine-phosphate synthase enzyme [Omnitr
MKSFTEYLWFHTKTRRDLINITDTVEQLVKTSGVQEGFCLVSAMHITAGIWVNDDEEGLWQDFWELLERLAPFREDYKHHATGEDNGDAHLKRTLIHHQAMLPITKGTLDLGPWEQVFYAECDGKRKKRVVVKILGE